MCIIPIFRRFKDKKLYSGISSIIMKEDGYSEPAIRRVEMLCSPEHTKPLETRLFYRTTPIFCFYAQIICNNAPLLCAGHLQNCYHGFIFWVLKRTVSLRWYYTKLSADLTKGSFGHFSSFSVIKISKTSKFSIFCMFLQ